MMNPRITLRREAGHGAFIPRGWQMAWYEPRRRVGVYYPAPLHWILRTLRELSYRVRIAVRAPAIEHLQVVELQHSHRDRQRLADDMRPGISQAGASATRRVSRRSKRSYRITAKHGIWACCSRIHPSSREKIETAFSPDDQEVLR